MALKKRLMAISTAGGLAALSMAVGPTVHVRAGATGDPSGDCAADTTANVNKTILTSPIYLALDVHTGSSKSVTVCYSDKPPGTASHFVGGVAGVFYPPSYGFGTTWCASDPTALVQVACGVGVWPTYSITSDGGAGRVLTLAVPFGYCVGTSFSGYAGCNGPSSGPAIGATGLVITTFGVSGAPGSGEAGASAAPTGTVFIDGVQQGFFTVAGAGVTPSAAKVGTGGQITQICTGSGCIPVPGVWAGTDGAPLATFEVGDRVINIPTPAPPATDSCVAVGTACPSPY